MFPNLCELLPELTDLCAVVVAEAEDCEAALKDSVSKPHGSKPWLAGAGAEEAGLLLLLTDLLLLLLLPLSLCFNKNNIIISCKKHMQSYV